MKIEEADKYFWVERREDFVKLCFDFLPESDGYMTDIKKTEALIKRKIDLKGYRCFAGVGKNDLIEPEAKEDIFSGSGSVYFLLPLETCTGIMELRKILLKYECNFRKAYKTFCYDKFVSIRKELCGSVIIGRTVLLNNEEFVLAPANVFNMCVYGLDIYMKGADKIEWEQTQFL